MLATRGPEAEVWVGLREPVPAATYLDWIERQDVDALLGSLNRVTVRAGAVVFVPAGVPHAIGAGLLVAELQEPTDFSIVCEWKGFPIDPVDSHLGLGWETALGAADLSVHVRSSRCPRRPVRSSGRTRSRPRQAASPS